MNPPRWGGPWLLVALLGVGLAAACAASNPRSLGIREPRFLALGDSYTIGEGISATERWPLHVSRSLRKSGVAIYDPEFIARTGWTTAELEAGIRHKDPTGPYELVSLMIGVNDQFRGQSTKSYRRGLRRLLRTAVDLADGRPERVIVISIPDWGATPFARDRDRREIFEEIDRFNHIAREEAERWGCPHVDVTPSSRSAGSGPEFWALDGLHPSGLLYRQWANLVTPVARRALTGGD